MRANKVLKWHIQQKFHSNKYHYFFFICTYFGISSPLWSGRCIVATRTIAPGEMILQDFSAASGPKQENCCIRCYTTARDGSCIITSELQVKVRYKGKKFGLVHTLANIWWDCSSRPAQNHSYNSLIFTFWYMIRPHNSSIENCHKCHFKLCVNCTSKEHGCALLEHEVINCRQNVWFFKRPNSPTISISP